MIRTEIGPDVQPTRWPNWAMDDGLLRDHLPPFQFRTTVIGSRVGLIHHVEQETASVPVTSYRKNSGRPTISKFGAEQTYGRGDLKLRACLTFTDIRFRPGSI